MGKRRFCRDSRAGTIVTFLGKDDAVRERANAAEGNVKRDIRPFARTHRLGEKTSHLRLEDLVEADLSRWFVLEYPEDRELRQKRKYLGLFYGNRQIDSV